MDLENLTPGMRQFTQVKEEYPDCLVFFRMGDFYETFYEDAKTASKELDITLTSRGKGDKKAPLAGIPFHALEPYLAKLIKKGYKVAIVEQLEDPKKAKGLVKRGVVRIVTPGTIIEAAMLDESTNNFIMSILSNEEKYALSFCDISTGEFLVGEFKDLDDAINQIVKFSPSECIMPLSLKVNRELTDRLRKLNVFVNSYDERYFNFEKANSKLKNHFDVINLRGFGIDSDLSVCVAGALLSYLQETQFNDLGYINKIKNIDSKNVMILDSTTLRNLEVIKNIREGSSKGSLLDVIDNTVTPLGARLIKKWLKEPLMNVNEIKERLDAVEVFVNNIVVKDDLVALLKQFNDIERLISRINYGNANARDLISLKNSLKLVPLLREKLVEKKGLLKDLRLNSIDDVVNIIENAIKDESPMSIREGDIIKLEYHPELKSLHDIKKNGKKYILELENAEKVKTGIKSLRIGFNKIFGYYIEVSKSNVPFVPKEYIRKQTTVNGERYITEDLKEQEAKILGADEKIKALEYELFQDVIKKIVDFTLDIQDVAKEIAVLDVILGFSNVALNRNYCKPVVDDSNIIELKESRHPVIETIESGFVPNDIRIETGEMMLITGPNMSGKSSLMRQVALNVLLAQIGSYVACGSARIGVVDRIFTRVGAHDDLVMGQSTFMVEMNETANILNNSTSKSLIILDEIGRGTSTFDGVAIAWSVAEYIYNKIKAKTLFATHYHVLNKLSLEFSRIKNYNIAVKEGNDGIVFLRHLIEGGTDKSYGVHVAKLAGLPLDVVERATELQQIFESEDKMIKKVKGEKIIEQKTLL